MKIDHLEKDLDKVFIDYKEFDRIRKWYLSIENMDATEFLNQKMFFPLNDFIIEVELNKNTQIKGLVQLVNYDPRHFHFYNEMIEIYHRREPENKRSYIEALDMTNIVHTNKQLEAYASIISNYIMGVMFYVCIKGKDRAVYIKEAQRHSESEENLQESKEKTYHDRELYFLRDIIIFVSEHQTKRSIQYLKDVWGVRGHLRHYRNGEIVFIKPYKKGRMRDTKDPESRKYLIERGEADEQTAD